MFKLFRKKLNKTVKVIKNLYNRKITITNKQKTDEQKNNNDKSKELNKVFVTIGCCFGVLLLTLIFKYIILDIVFNYDYIVHNGEKMKWFINNNNYIKTTNKHYTIHGSGTLTIELNENDNLFNALLRNGLERDSINSVLAMFNKKIDLRSLKPGQTFEVNYNFETILKPVDAIKKTAKNTLPVMKTLAEMRNITRMAFKQSNGIRYIVEKNNDSYVLHIEKPKLIVNTHVINGTIQNNLFTDAMVNDIKASTLYNVLNEYAFLIDFQRDLRKGDKFVFLVETSKDGEGDIIEEKVLYSNLILSDHDYEVFRFEGRFYDRNGRSIQKNLLRTPVDGAKITSGFTSRRKHPILGYTRAHKGIDMAVPTGTPIYAAGDGVVEEIQLNHPAYGKFVLIRHNREYSTKYAHMSRVGNIKVGQQVKQRQTIGYVGMTGLATGPHLHYEVIRYGKHINPRSVRSVATKQLDDKKMEQFKILINNVDELLEH